MAKTSTRSLGSPSKPGVSPGSTWTPAARMSIGSSAGPATSFASWMPQAYTSALPEWIPLFESGTVADSVLPCRVYADFAPATTFDRPRGTTTSETRSGYTPAPAVVGVATTAPCTMWASDPNSDAAAVESAATSAASSATVTSTVVLPEAGTATGFTENETSAPCVVPTSAALRSYVIDDPLVLCSVSGSVSLYATFDGS